MEGPPKHPLEAVIFWDRSRLPAELLIPDAVAPDASSDSYATWLMPIYDRTHLSSLYYVADSAGSVNFGSGVSGGAGPSSVGEQGMKIGVISDTHGYVDPHLEKVLMGVDAILHAGDVGPGEVLEDLERLARVYAVRGNVDPTETNLPPSLSVRFQNLRVELQHQLPVPQQELENWADGTLLQRLNPHRRDQFLEGFDLATNVVVFGHSHRPCLVTIGHRLFFNPGSSGARRFRLPRCCGILELFPRGVRGSIMGLEGESSSLPQSIWLPLGE